MKTIKIPVSEVWELVNKPHRFFSTVREEIKKIPVGTEVEYLDWDAETKQEVLNTLNEFKENGWKALNTNKPTKKNKLVDNTIKIELLEKYIKTFDEYVNQQVKEMLERNK